LALAQQAFFAILPVSNLHAFERFHMGIALLALSGLFQGFSGLHRNPAVKASKRQPTYLRPVWAQRKPSTICGSGLKAPMPAHTQRVVCTSNAPTLRVLRVSESEGHVKGAGRMVISGRMADVCAELDRLAALEAAQATC
jgi:hypothetical protein